MTSSYLMFLVSGRIFGVRLSGAIEILPWRALRKVPLSHSYVEGLIDYRGIIYPVFNLVRRLGLSKPGPIGFTTSVPERPDAAQSIILLEEHQIPLGILVDSVIKMTKLDEPSGDAAETSVVDPQYIKGIVSDNDQEVVILDFERLFHAG